MLVVPVVGDTLVLVDVLLVGLVVDLVYLLPNIQAAGFLCMKLFEC